MHLLKLCRHYSAPVCGDGIWVFGSAVLCPLQPRDVRLRSRAGSECVCVCVCLRENDDEGNNEILDF